MKEMFKDTLHPLSLLFLFLASLVGAVFVVNVVHIRSEAIALKKTCSIVAEINQSEK